MNGVEIKLLETEAVCLTEDDINDLIENSVNDKENRLLLAHHNLHSLYLLKSGTKFDHYFQKVRFIWIDGMPVIWLLKTLGFPITRRYRLTFLDWQYSFFKLAAKNRYRVFLLGADRASISAATNKLEGLYPLVDFRCHHGYLDQRLSQSVIQKINEHAPHILLVGMGMPVQEEWILKHHDQLNARCIMPIGGYFDYISGNSVTPPRWTGQLGLEGMYRFATNPRRLWSRYLVEPWVVIAKLISFRLKQRRSA